ncbi:suppressor of fused domain protein [Peptostreptococcaceae bacterium AGR-M142]
MNLDKFENLMRKSIIENDIDSVRKLIEEHQEYLFAETQLGSWLHIAAEKGKLELVKYFVEKKLDVNLICGISRCNPLTCAAREGHLDIVKYLYSCGSKLDTSTPSTNPIIAAINGINLEVIKFLIEKGIDIKVSYKWTDAINLDAYTYAVANGNPEIAKYLKSLNPEFTYEPIDRDSNYKAFINKHYGKIETTIKEIVASDDFGIDVHVILPNEKNNFTTFITQGMGDKSMDIKNQNPDLDFAELVVKIPASWEISQENFESKKYFWILEWLKRLAYMPHHYDGIMAKNLIIPNGEPPINVNLHTSLSCFLTVLPKDEEKRQCVIGLRNKINFYNVIPISWKEREIAQNNSVEYLIEQLKELEKLKDIDDYEIIRDHKTSIYTLDKDIFDVEDTLYNSKEIIDTNIYYFEPSIPYYKYDKEKNIYGELKNLGLVEQEDLSLRRLLDDYNRKTNKAYEVFKDMKIKVDYVGDFDFEICFQDISHKEMDAIYDENLPAKLPHITMLNEIEKYFDGEQKYKVFPTNSMIFSQKAVDVFTPYIDKLVEFIPVDLVDYPNEKYYLVNILNKIDFGEYYRYGNYNRAIISNLVSKNMIFKYGVLKTFNQPFICFNDEFLKIAKENNLDDGLSYYLKWSAKESDTLFEEQYYHNHVRLNG